MNRKFLESLVTKHQEIQKRNAPDSVAWLEASREINAIARILAGGK